MGLFKSELLKAKVLSVRGLDVPGTEVIPWPFMPSMVSPELLPTCKIRLWHKRFTPLENPFESSELIAQAHMTPADFPK